MSYGQHIATSSSGYSGNIYHTGGNIGIGTTNPETLLHLLVEHNSSTDYPTIRLENKINLDTIIDIDDNDDNITKSAIAQNYWDISLNGSHLDFLFGHNQNALQNIFSINKNQTTLNTGELKVNGTVEADNFVINGQSITADSWQQNGDNIYYTGGNVGIGTDEPRALFSVNNEFLITSAGYVYAREIKITPDSIPDYVFDTDYDIISLDSLQKYIAVNKHLPAIPSASEIQQKGMNIGEFNKLLLLKIEELTLYIIQQQKEIEELKKQRYE